MDKVEKVARVLCERGGYDPEHLEPGDIAIQTGWNERRYLTAGYEHLVDNGTIQPDGHNGKEPCCFMWRQYIFDAKAVIAALGEDET